MKGCSDNKRGNNLSPAVHFATSLVGAGIVYSMFGSFISAVAFFASGVLVDLDHLLDYLKEYNMRGLSVHRFFKTCYEDKFKKAILIFHSYEFLFIFWIVITIFRLDIFWIALALGMTMHLVLDQLRNNVFALSYFLTYRWIKNFNTKDIFIERLRKD